MSDMYKQAAPPAPATTGKTQTAKEAAVAKAGAAGAVTKAEPTQEQLEAARKARAAVVSSVKSLQFDDHGTLVVKEVGDLFALASWMRQNQMVPASFKTDGQVVIAAMFGRRIGLDPIESVNNIAVIGNKPTMYGSAIVSFLRMRGVKVRSGITHPTERFGDDSFGWCKMLIPGDTDWVESTFTVADAKTANLWGGKNTKDGNDAEASNWARFPGDQLMWKAVGRCMRFHYGLGGIAMHEDMADGSIPPAFQVASAPSVAAQPSKDSPKLAAPADVDPILEEIVEAEVVAAE